MILRSRPRLAAFAIAVSILSLGLHGGNALALAGECATPVLASPALGEHDVTARLDFLHHSMVDAARAERFYAIGWTSTFAAFAGGTWVLLPLADDQHGQRISSAWSSATSVAAGLQILIEPLRIIFAKRRLERLLAQAPVQQDQCAVLRDAEILLVRAADSEQSVHSARSHILGLLTTVGLGLILGYALKRPESAAINTTVGFFISEAMIATRPQTAIRRLKSYRSGDFSALAAPPSKLQLGASFSPNISPIGSSYGVSLAGAF